MPVTMKDVRVWLDADEVDYGRAKRLGATAIPLLIELAKGGDLGLASKATYLASLIKSEESAAVLEAALARNEPALKVAAASAVRNLPEVQAEKILELLKDDPDPGIRKVLVKSVDGFGSQRFVERVQHMADSDPDPFVRDLASGALAKMKRRRRSK